MEHTIHVSLNFQQLLDAVKGLSPKEKLQVNEVLWEENMDIPQEHQKLVLDRVKSARQNPKRLLDF